MPRNVEGGRNELDLFGGGGGGLFTFYNYGPEGAPSNAPPSAFERGITRAPSPGFFTSPGGVVITDPEQIENILNPPQFAIGPGYDDQNVSKEPPELDPTLIQDLVDEVIFGDPGALEDTTRSPVETIFNDDGTITTVIDPTLITLPPLLGDPVIEDVEGGGGATASPETEGTPQPTEPAPETAPESESAVEPGFSDDAATSESTYDPTKEYEIGDVITDVEGNEWEYQPYDPRLPGYYGWIIKKPTPEIIAEYETETGNTYEEGDNIWIIGNPSNPTGIPSLEDDPDYTYVDPEPELEEETTTPTTSGPSIVITTPPSVSRPATTPSDVVTEGPTGVETPSDTANTGTDATGQQGQQGINTGGTGPGEAGNGGDGTGDGDGSGDGGMFSSTKKAKDYFDTIGYQPVAVPNLILPNQPVNTSIVPVRSQRNSFMDSSIVASMFKDLI